MADLLNTKAISHYLEQLLKSAKQHVILISPYFKLNDYTKQEFEELDGAKLEVQLVIRNKKLSPVERKWLEGLPSFDTYLCDNLHAKCYLNEREAIVTSMNFYESGRASNHEMGIRVTKEHDPELYDEIHAEATKLIKISRQVKKPTRETRKVRNDGASNGETALGFCIRCRAEVKRNPKVPYCKDCYSQWKGTYNKSEVERYCHICGQPTQSTLNKPMCRSCYKVNKDNLKSPTASGK